MNIKKKLSETQVAGRIMVWSRAGGNKMKKKMLVVDDYPVVRFFMERLFEDSFDVQCASDGAQALEMVRESQPDVVLLDVWMPGQSGIRILEYLRDKFPSVKIVMVSWDDNPDLMRKTMALGANDYVTKPMDSAYLRSVVFTQVPQCASGVVAEPMRSA